MKLFTRRARKRQARRDNVGRVMKEPGYLRNRPQDVGTGVSFYDAIPRATVVDGAELR